MGTLKFLATVALAFLFTALVLSLVLVSLIGSLSALTAALVLFNAFALSAAVWLAYPLVSWIRGRFSPARPWPQPINGLDLILTVTALGALLVASLASRGSFGPKYVITAAAVDAQGDLWVATSSSRYGRNALGTVRKVNPEGRLTDDFKTADLSREGLSRFHLIPHASGAATVLLDGWGSRYGSVSGRLGRLNAAGKVDASFAKDGVNASRLAARPDGSLWLTTGAGPLVETSATGQTLRELPLPARLAAENGSVTALAVDGDALLVAVAKGGTLGGELLRLKPDGTWDEVFSRSLAAGLAKRNISLKNIDAVHRHAQGLLLIGRFDARDTAESFDAIRLASTGELDAAFAPFRYPVGGESLLAVGSVAVAADSGIIMGGIFHRQYIGKLRGLYRFLPDGRPDPAFAPNWTERLLDAGLTGDVNHLAPLPDGRVYAAGAVVHKSGRREPFLFRLQANGALDETFISDWSAGLLKRPWSWRSLIPFP